MKHFLITLFFTCWALVAFAQQGTQIDSTTIDSDKLTVKSDDEKTLFTFSQNVVVKANNLQVNCNTLQVISGRTENTKKDDDSRADVGSIEKIIAIGNVIILQGEREATCGRAEIYPYGDPDATTAPSQKNGLIILKENPILRDLKEKVVSSAYEIRFHQGDREAELIASPDGSIRPKVILDQIPDIGGISTKK